MHMISMLLKVWNDCLTERDNHTFCPVRILGTISLIHYLILSHLELIRHGHDFSLTDMATGISIILGVVGATVSFKNKSEQ